MIVSTPVDLPRLEPDDWNRWWDLWRECARPMTKEGKSPNAVYGQWTGFDVMVTDRYYTVYKAPVIDLETLYPSLYNQLDQALFGYNVAGVRFCQSQAPFAAHKDNFLSSWSLRCLMHYQDESQWYYERLDRTDRRRLRLPKETNWWAYLDGKCLHGTEFNPDAKKILVQVYATQKTFLRLAEDGISKFDPQYMVAYD